jgi:hypothetical protein
MIENKKENKNSIIGERIGYLTMFFIFSIMLYIILNLLDKIPQSWNYLHILIITLILIIIGKTLRRLF